MDGSPPSSATWVVARLGAYMHYAVPRILQRASLLERFYTDFYAGDAGTGALRLFPRHLRSSLMKRGLGRVAQDLPRERIHSFPLFGLEYSVRQFLASDIESRSQAYLDAGSKFGRLVVKSGFGEAGAVFAFNTAAMDILKAARERGLYTVMEQTIAPRALEEELLAEEQARFPGWELPRPRASATKATIERERAEWDLADRIVCPSGFVGRGIAHCGGPVERCMVVPYGVDERFSSVERASRAGPLRVLIAGEAGLRKGVAYATETARLLGRAAEFRWLGKVTLEPEARSLVERWVHLYGIVPRSEVRQHFEWADVCFLPSVCEGSATVTYEALMSGLPVVTTPNAGSLVRDGVDGFIVPVRDTTAMAERLRCLHEDRAMLERMMIATRDSVKEVSLKAYEKRLLQALKGV